MPSFYYTAKDRHGQVVTGLIEADSEETAAEMLAERSLMVIAFKAKRDFAWFGKIQGSLGMLNRVKAKDLVVFSRQLSVMISATIPIVQALRTLIVQTTNVTLKIIISEVADEVEGGAKLSLALSRHPKVFNGFFVNLIKSGETAGQVDEVLNYLAEQQEKDYELKARIRGAMIYPIFILVGLLVVGTIMMVFVVPQITGMLLESGSQLPLSTRILIGTSNFLTAWWWLLALAVVVLTVGWRFYVRTVNGRYQWDFLKLKLPILSKLFKDIYLVRFTRSMATLIKGGVSLTQGLAIVAKVVSNMVYEDLIMSTAQEVEGGNSVASVFLQSKNVPPMLSQMMVIGEQTGKLDEVLAKLSEFYTREVDNTVRNLTTIMEPVVLTLMGIGVGILVAAIILPMYNLASSF
ncbi:MAG: type II secretion system F family protein [bacterium]